MAHFAFVKSHKMQLTGTIAQIGQIDSICGTRAYTLRNHRVNDRLLDSRYCAKPTWYNSQIFCNILYLGIRELSDTRSLHCNLLQSCIILQHTLLY